MLRDTRHTEQPDLCREDSLQETDGEVFPEGEDGAGDLYPPLAAAQARGRVPRLL